MRSISVALSLLALAIVPAFGAPADTLLTVEKTDGPTNGKYIISLKEGVDKTALVSHVKITSTITEDWDIINAFAARLDNTTLNFLRAHQDVTSIAEDSIVTADATITQTNATWGLQRITQPRPLGRTDAGALNYTYRYNSSAGSGIDIYVLDTGIFTRHSTFQGRARWGATFGGYKDADGHGHGTHVAGTAAGFDYGVAKAAHLIAVKVLNDSNRGFITDFISGMNWAMKQVASTGRPSIVSMSLGASISRSLDSAVASLTKNGIHVVVSAGNNNINASRQSPARAPSALTVGAVDIRDQRATFSNYGAPVKVFAPGVNVISSWIGSTNAKKSISGTSMATPHVSGIVAYLISKEGNLPPAAMIRKIQRLAVKGKLKRIPQGTVNYLVQYQ